MPPARSTTSHLSARLKLVLGAHTLGEFTLTEGQVIVGRDPACALRLPAELVKLRRAHLQLWIADAHLWMRPLGACVLNGSPIMKDAALSDGDVLSLDESVRLHVALRHIDPNSGASGAPPPRGRTTTLLLMGLCALGITAWGGWRWWAELEARATRREQAQIELWMRLESGEQLSALDTLIQAALTPPVRIPGREAISDPLSSHIQRVLSDLIGRPPKRPVDTFLRDAVLRQLQGLTEAPRCQCRLSALRPELTRIFNEELERIGVPSERATWLIYIPWIESCYRPTACSHVGALGMWQFMPKTARRYGLTVTDGLDERCDWRKSTRAAAQYFTYTFSECGADYPLLAIAAYNTGEARACAIAKNTKLPEEQRDVLPFYTHGYLLPETVAYVPRFLAATFLDQHPEEAYRLVTERLGRPLTPPKCERAAQIPAATSCSTLPPECPSTSAASPVKENELPP